MTAHEGPEGRLLLATLKADDEVQAQTSPTAQIAIVIDRSGSMSGRKLEITKIAVANLIRSLRPEDRVAVVTFDDSIDVVSGMAAPSEHLARKIAHIHSGGSTNLYEGWLVGAKLVGPGGRVVLLSDGQANVGAFTQAEDLRRHAERSYVRYKVTTTTIGVGDHYDEALMAGMAQAGGGGHYFAQTPEAITDAFSQERFAIGAVSASHVSLRYEGQTVQVGHLWAGETRKAVMRISNLGGEPATVRFTSTADGQTHTLPLQMPAEFGRSDEATLELLIAEAAKVEEESANVRDPRQAQEVREKARGVLLLILGHVSADSDLAVAVKVSLELTMQRLEHLERFYNEEDANIHRKRSRQSHYNVTQREKSFSAFAEDASVVASMRMESHAAMDLRPDPASIGLLPMDRWLGFPAMPVALLGGILHVVSANPRDGFLVAALEKELGLRVRLIPARMTEDDIRAALRSVV